MIKSSTLAAVINCLLPMLLLIMLGVRVNAEWYYYAGVIILSAADLLNGLIICQHNARQLKYRRCRMRGKK